MKIAPPGPVPLSVEVGLYRWTNMLEMLETWVPHGEFSAKKVIGKADK